jgi:hypothetical protein
MKNSITKVTKYLVESLASRMEPVVNRIFVIADKVKELDQTNKDKEKLLKNINGI